MINKTVAEITAALQELRTNLAQSMGKRRMQEIKMKESEAEIQGFKNAIREKEAGIRQKEVDIQKLRQMIMEIKSLIPRAENDLKKIQSDYSQLKTAAEVHQHEATELQRQLEEAQHVRPRENGEPEHRHF